MAEVAGNRCGWVGTGLVLDTATLRVRSIALGCAGHHGLLRLPQGFGFGHVARGQILVKPLHQLTGAGIVHLPEGGHHRFDILGKEVIAQSGHFNAFFVLAALGGFAGREHRQMNAAQVIELADVGDFQRSALAQDQKGLFWIFGDKLAMGGDVQNPVVDQVFEGVEGEILIQDFAARENAFGVAGLMADNAINFIGDVGQGIKPGYRIGEAQAQDGVIGGIGGKFVGGVGESGGEDGGDCEALSQVLLTVEQVGQGHVAGGAV